MPVGARGLMNFWDSLSSDEGEAMERLLDQLAGEEWARPLIADIGNNGGITQANKTRLFELRVGDAIHHAGVVPKYEVPGEGSSTVDFGFTSGGKNWLAELMRLEETDAAQRATHERVDSDGIHWSGRALATDADDPRESQEGETLKTIQRICQKCERNRRPHKFPSVQQDMYHAIVVDCRTFLNGGDAFDRIHIGLGGEFVAQEYRHYWEGALIAGVFSERNPQRGAAFARERVHFIGFVKENTYQPGELTGATQFIANPHLFADARAVRAAIATWPLQPALMLNGRE